MVVHACNPAIWGTEAGASLHIQGQPERHSETQSQKQRLDTSSVGKVPALEAQEPKFHPQRPH